MNMLLRAGRWYWRVNTVVWWQVRRFTVPLHILFGALSVVAWAAGVRTCNPVLMWMPAMYAGAWAVTVFAEPRR
ncbi:hypothetical protein ACH4OW_26235 [Streptomyces sp. NPDC017056]|uniref:hypothetical protein n=1 Tax=Streptomyces sp. NPDC017056 TaxID=3364973 RepID=UPI003796816C